MRQYTITPVSGQPNWDTIPQLQVDNYQWVPPVDIQMTAQLCYSPDGLHIHLKAREKNIRAEYTEPLSMVCEDSCMEFFFRPVAEEMRYFNFEINPNGRTYIGFGNGIGDLIRLIPSSEDQLLQKKVAYTEDGWEVYFTFPVSMIRVFFPGYQLKPGMKIYANCYKCGDLTEQRHYISWNLIEGENASFHEPAYFGEMTLG